MKVGEARQTYSFQLKKYNETLHALNKQREGLKVQMAEKPEETDLYQEQLDALEINYDKVKDKYDEYKSFMDQVMGQWEAKMNSETAKQQGEAAKEYATEMSKIMTVARRMMKGDTVPGSDEKKLMEFDRDMYLAAKNMQMMAQLEKKRHKKHDSLWEDEEEKGPAEDPMEAADNQEFSVGPVPPEIVDVGELTGESGSGIEEG